MVVEVPARELRRRDARGQGVEEAEDAVGAGPVAVEDRLVDDLVKENGAVEDDESEDERARDADPEALELPAERESRGKKEELASRDREVANRALAVELLQDLVRHRGREPLAEVPDRGVVVARLHHPKGTSTSGGPGAFPASPPTSSATR